VNDLGLLTFDAVLAVTGLAFLALGARTGSLGTWRRALATYAVTFPPDVTADQVTLFLSGCRGLVAPWWLRPFVVRGFGVEIVATSEGIAHYLHVPDAQAAVVLSALRAAIPAARAAKVALALPRPGLAVQFAHTGAHRVLADGVATHVSSALLSTMQPLASGEVVRLQWLLSPAGPAAPPPVVQSRRTHGRGALAQGLERFIAGPSMDAGQVADWKRKHASPVFVLRAASG
jgi:hypothetical protein